MSGLDEFEYKEWLKIDKEIKEDFDIHNQKHVETLSYFFEKLHSKHEMEELKRILDECDEEE